MLAGVNLGAAPVGFGEGLDGSLYVGLINGVVYRVNSDQLFADGFE